MEEESTNCVKSFSRLCIPSIIFLPFRLKRRNFTKFFNKQTLLCPNTKNTLPYFKNKTYYHSLANVVDLKEGSASRFRDYIVHCSLLHITKIIFKSFVILILYSDTFLNYTAPPSSITEQCTKLKYQQ
jgi:hypothetical protein